jgi:hypothetical protein
VRACGLRRPSLRTSVRRASSSAFAFRSVQPSVVRPRRSFTWRPAASTYFTYQTTPRFPSRRITAAPLGTAGHLVHEALHEELLSAQSPRCGRASCRTRGRAQRNNEKGHSASPEHEPILGPFPVGCKQLGRGRPDQPQDAASASPEDFSPQMSPTPSSSSSFRSRLSSKPKFGSVFPPPADALFSEPVDDCLPFVASVAAELEAGHPASAGLPSDPGVWNRQAFGDLVGRKKPLAHVSTGSLLHSPHRHRRPDKVDPWLGSARRIRRRRGMGAAAVASEVRARGLVAAQRGRSQETRFASTADFVEASSAEI